MKNIITVLMLVFTFNATSFAQEKSASAEARNTYKDIEQTLGMVPTFLKDFPQQGISGAWEDMKGLQLNPKTAISGKDKELIGLAVSSQVPCRFCVYFHTQAAILNGASVDEINESIAVAAAARRWSTVLSGNQSDLNEFKQEVNQLLKNAQNKKNMQAMEVKPVVLEMKTAQDAYEDMQNTLGLVPTFLRNYPASSIVGAWKELKAIEFNPATALQPKIKHLIGLAVSAQIPCDYCTYYKTEAALFENANKQELQEAVAMAGITRQWSTVLNGQYTNEKQFQGEVDRIMKFLKAKSAKEVTQNI